jgi:hypothetical protein
MVRLTVRVLHPPDYAMDDSFRFETVDHLCQPGDMAGSPMDLFEQRRGRVDVPAQTQRGDRLGGLLTPGSLLMVAGVAAVELAPAVADVVGAPASRVAGRRRPTDS